MHPIKTTILAFTFAAAFVAHAAAAEEKPIISINSKSLEASVTIEATLKAHPGLYENLLAEGRRVAAKWRVEADQDLRDNPSFFEEGRKWTNTRAYSQRSLIGRYVSVLRDDHTYQGGAHPNSYSDTILWDREAKKRISIRPFFTETADGGPTMTALAKSVRLAVAVAKLHRTDEEGKKGAPTPEQMAAEDPQLQGIQPSVLKLGPITLAPAVETGRSSGLTFHFSPYAVGSYVEGPYTVFVPWTEFRQFLSPEGQALFGGERPKEDEIEY